MKQVIEYQSLAGADFYKMVSGIIKDLKEYVKVSKEPVEPIGTVTFNGVFLEIKPTSDIDDQWRIYQSGLRLNELEDFVEKVKKILGDIGEKV